MFLGRHTIKMVFKVFGLNTEGEEGRVLLHPISGWHRCFAQGRRPRVLLAVLISTLLLMQLFSFRSSVLSHIYTQIGYEPSVPMRVALLYAGNVRSFVYEPVWRNHLQHMIRPLSEGNVELTVFMALDEENDKPIDDIGLERTPLWELLELFQAKGVFYRTKGEMEPLQCRPAEGCRHFKENIHRKFSPIYWGQAEMVNAAFRLARKYENENDVEFDWFIRVRPDFVFPSPIPSLPTVTNHINAPVCDTGPKLLKRNYQLTCVYNITDTTIVTVNAERTDPFCDKCILSSLV